jgi:hypothetical protein
MATLMGRAVALLLSAGLIACTTLDDVQDARKLEIKTGVPVSNFGFYYDDVMGAYRERVKSGSSGPGPLLRDGKGRRIQSEQELFRPVEESKKEVLVYPDNPVSTGALVIYGIGFIGAAVYYWPVTLGLPIMNGILAVPFSPVASHLNTNYEREAEQDYEAGRHHFDTGELEEALVEWEKARVLMSSMQATSDINYWRGRAFEALHQPDNALFAYDRFLGESTSSQPSYFRHKYTDVLIWKEEEEDAVRRLNIIVARGVSAMPDLQSGASTGSSPP